MEDLPKRITEDDACAILEKREDTKLDYTKRECIVGSYLPLSEKEQLAYDNLYYYYDWYCLE